MYRVDNAIIMAAGTSSRFAPLSYENHKSLLTVRGEVLIERQIRQIKEAGIDNIVLVTGYMKERFEYLKGKFGISLVENTEFCRRNNHSSIYAVRHLLGNSYICSSDNYFTGNPFECSVEDAYYAAVYAHGNTPEWCIYEGEDGYINKVNIGGQNAWYMMGHVFWNEPFSQKFIEILEREYDTPEIQNKLWEAIYAEHLDELKLRIRHYDDSQIFEFDSLDELRTFDKSYINDTRSAIIKQLASNLGCREAELNCFHALKAQDGTQAVGFTFCFGGEVYKYYYKNKEWEKEDGKKYC